MCHGIVYRCVEICCCYGSASVSCKVLAGGMYFVVVCLPPFEWELQRDSWGMLKDKVFTHSLHNLAELRAAIEIEFETLHATLDFTHRVCRILYNHCLACIAEDGSQFEHKMQI